MFALYNRGCKIPVKEMEKNKLRLLVVEDEKKLCDMIAKSLHQVGYEVDTCNDGEEALAQEKNIELIQKSQNSSDGRSDGTEESLLVACSVNNNEKPEDELILTGSDILIYRMLYNLIENAIKYNRTDGTVTVSAKREKNEVVLTVADTGNGIDESFREQIFEPFFRVDKSRSRELGGVGLGLAMVREIVRVHDGKIEVRGNEQGGTTFEVRMSIE
jgi:signal transduction histidine kinase